MTEKPRRCCGRRHDVDGRTLVCVCKTAGPHEHETADGTRFIGALTGVLTWQTPTPIAKR